VVGGILQTNGYLIVIEGPDGVGKSELATRLFRSIQNSGKPVEIITFPGNEPGTLGKLVYDLHHHPERFDVEHLAPASIQLLHIAAHVDAIERQILPALQRGVDVVLDRFWWSAFVYGLAGGADRALLEQMIAVEKLAWQSVQPDLLFLIDRSEPFRNEPDLWPMWRQYYADLFSIEKTHHPCYLIENQGTIEETEAAMRDILEKSERSHV
jgi:thymidylate kinase